MKKLAKKMILHRETLRVLDGIKLDGVAGGITLHCAPTVTCADTCDHSCAGSCPVSACTI